MNPTPKLIRGLVVLMFVAHAMAIPSYNCTNCMNFEDMMQIRREQIMEQILERLNLKSVPRITKGSNNHIMDFVMQNQEFASVMQNERHKQNMVSHRVTRFDDASTPSSFMAPPVQTIVIGPKPLPDNINFPVTYFNFDGLLRKPVVSSKLHVVLRRLHHNRGPEDGTPINVIAYERHGNGTIGLKLAEQQHIYQSDATRNVVELPISNFDLQHWMTDLYDPSFNQDGIMGVYVEAFYREHNLAHNSPGSMSLHLQVEDDISGRDRRQERICRPEDNNPRCCLYELEIDFVEAGWDFVIAPRTYRANMCNGMCEPRQLKANMYTDLASSTRKGNRGGPRATYSPCCHPVEFDDLTIIYVTENNTIHKAVISDLIARKCGCS